MNIKNYRPIKEVLEEKVEAALLELDNIENVVQARVNKEIVKEYKSRKLSELELKEEQRGITQSSKQTRNARAICHIFEFLNIFFILCIHRESFNKFFNINFIHKVLV